MKCTYTYKKRNKFPHRFVLDNIDVKDKNEIYNWLKENCGKYCVDYIYWGLRGNSQLLINYSEIYFRDKTLSMAFKLAWT